MLHKVIALDTYERLKVSDKIEGNVTEGMEFEVDDERLDVLLGNNFYKVPFVKLADEPKKRGRKKKE